MQPTTFHFFNFTFCTKNTLFFTASKCNFGPNKELNDNEKLRTCIHIKFSSFNTGAIPLMLVFSAQLCYTSHHVVTIIDAFALVL